MLTSRVNLDKLFKKTFLKNALTLMLGTALGQLIIILSTPILTRLYSPEDFGVYGNFIAITAIFAAIVSLRYELAIVLPKENRDSIKVVKLSLIIAIIVSILVFIGAALFSTGLVEKLEWFRNDFIYLIPMYIFLTGIYQILNYWYTRNKKFRIIASSQTIRSLFLVLFQLIIGLFFIRNIEEGLVVGHVVGQLLAVMLFLYFLKEDKTELSKTIKLKELKDVALEYKDFPIYSSGTSFLNTASAHIPIILLTIYFSAGVAGLYVLGNRLLSMPASLIGNAIAQVFLQKTAREKGEQINLKSAFKLWGILTPISLLINILVIVLAPWIFSFAFGDSWEKAGDFARWISLWTVFKFVSTPLSSISYTYNKQKVFFYLQILLLIARIIALMIGGILDNAILAIALFSIVGAIFNIFTSSMYIRIESGKSEAFIAFLVNVSIFIFLISLIFWV